MKTFVIRRCSARSTICHAASGNRKFFAARVFTVIKVSRIKPTQERKSESERVRQWKRGEPATLVIRAEITRLIRDVIYEQTDTRLPTVARERGPDRLVPRQPALLGNPPRISA